MQFPGSARLPRPRHWVSFDTFTQGRTHRAPEGVVMFIFVNPEVLDEGIWIDTEPTGSAPGGPTYVQPGHSPGPLLQFRFMLTEGPGVVEPSTQRGCEPS